MDVKTRAELESVKNELQSIINELNNIAWGVRGDFTGIGNEECFIGIKKVVDQYQWVKRQLNNID